MKIITKEEWDNTPDEYKKVYDGTPYMVYKETYGKICFGPVKTKEEDSIIDFRMNLRKINS